MKFFKKHLSIIFILATFVGVFHHHHDLHEYADCQVCTIQSNISNADTPSETSYLSDITLFSEPPFTSFATFVSAQSVIILQARAPPIIS